MKKPAAPKSGGSPIPAPASAEAQRRRAWRAETIGIIILTLLILLYTVARYGAHINWSAR